MIQKQLFFTTSDGTPHKTIELAQANELTSFLISSEVVGAGWEKEKVEQLSANIIEQKDAIIDILTMTAASKPKARKINGGTKARKPKEAIHPSNEPVSKQARPATDVPGD